MKKNSFVSYTAEEVMAFEAETYVLQVGCDAFIYDGKWAFTKKSVNTHYNRILRELLHQVINGKDEEKENANRIILSLRVVPLRLH